MTYIGFDEGTHGQHIARRPEGTEYIRAATHPPSSGEKITALLAYTGLRWGEGAQTNPETQERQSSND